MNAPTPAMTHEWAINALCAEAAGAVGLLRCQAGFEREVGKEALARQLEYYAARLDAKIEATRDEEATFREGVLRAIDSCGGSDHGLDPQWAAGYSEALATAEREVTRMFERENGRG